MLKAEPDNSGHILVEVNITDDLSGVNPSTVELTFNNKDDLSPFSATVKMQSMGSDLYSITIPEGGFWHTNAFPHGARIAMEINCKDNKDNEASKIISPYNNQYITAFNQEGQNAAIVITSYDNPHLDIEVEIVDEVNDEADSIITIKNNNYVWAELLPKLNGVKLPLPSLSNFDDVMSWSLSSINRKLLNSVDGGDFLKNKQIGLIGWPPILGGKPAIRYNIHTILNDEISIRANYKYGGVSSNAANAYIFSANILWPIVQYTTSLYAGNKSVVESKTIATFELLVDIVNEFGPDAKAALDAFYGEPSPTNIKNLLLEVSLFILKKQQENGLKVWVNNRLRESIQKQWDNGIITDQITYETSIDNLDDTTEHVNKAVKNLAAIIGAFEALLQEGFVAGNLAILPPSETIQLKHQKQLSLQTLLFDTITAKQGIPEIFYSGFEDGNNPFEEKVLRWNLGNYIDLKLSIGNIQERTHESGLQFLINIWPKVELFDPEGNKVESIDLGIPDSDFNEQGNLIPEYTLYSASAGQTYEVNRDELSLAPDDDAVILIQDYELNTNNHPTNFHTYKPGIYKLKYQYFLYGLDDVEGSVPLTTVKEIKVQIVDQSIPDPPSDIAIDTDMVDTCQEKKASPANCFSAVLVVVKFQGTQRGGTGMTTVDHSDIRGLGTA